MRSKFKVESILLGVLFLLGTWSLAQSPEVRYKQITGRIPNLPLEAFFSSQKKTDQTIFIGSIQSEACTKSINTIMEVMYQVKNDKYYIDYDALNSRQQKDLKDSFGITEVPSILRIKEGQVEVQSPQDLLEVAS